MEKDTIAEGIIVGVGLVIVGMEELVVQVGTLFVINVAMDI